MALQSFGLSHFLRFLMIHTVGRTHRTGDQPVARLLPTHRTTQTQNKRTQASMRRVGFGHTIPVFRRAKTVHASDRAATVIDTFNYDQKYHELHPQTLLNNSYRFLSHSYSEYYQLSEVYTFLDIIHRPNLYLKWRFGDFALSPSSRKKPILLGLIDRAGLHLWTLEVKQDKI
jgi:hypothetical protein